jgi:predicted metal-dependent hydrolase
MPDAAHSREAFKARVREWAGRLSAGAPSVVIRPMRRKWASYSQSGRLTFDDRVLALDGPLQDYVIVHELLHVHVPNHGRLWKSLMRAHLGEFETAERRLKLLVAAEGDER